MAIFDLVLHPAWWISGGILLLLLVLPGLLVRVWRGLKAAWGCAHKARVFDTLRLDVDLLRGSVSLLDVSLSRRTLDRILRAVRSQPLPLVIASAGVKRIKIRLAPGLWKPSVLHLTVDGVTLRCDSVQVPEVQDRTAATAKWKRCALHEKKAKLKMVDALLWHLPQRARPAVAAVHFLLRHAVIPFLPRVLRIHVCVTELRAAWRLTHVPNFLLAGRLPPDAEPSGVGSELHVSVRSLGSQIEFTRDGFLHDSVQLKGVNVSVSTHAPSTGGTLAPVRYQLLKRWAVELEASLNLLVQQQSAGMEQSVRIAASALLLDVRPAAVSSLLAFASAVVEFEQYAPCRVFRPQRGVTKAPHLWWQHCGSSILDHRTRALGDLRPRAMREAFGERRAVRRRYMHLYRTIVNRKTRWGSWAFVSLTPSWRELRRLEARLCGLDCAKYRWWVWAAASAPSREDLTRRMQHIYSLMAQPEHTSSERTLRSANMYFARRVEFSCPKLAVTVGSGSDSTAEPPLEVSITQLRATGVSEGTPSSHVKHITAHARKCRLGRCQQRAGAAADTVDVICSPREDPGSTPASGSPPPDHFVDLSFRLPGGLQRLVEGQFQLQLAVAPVDVQYSEGVLLEVARSLAAMWPRPRYSPAMVAALPSMGQLVRCETGAGAAARASSQLPFRLGVRVGELRVLMPTGSGGGPAAPDEEEESDDDPLGALLDDAPSLTQAARAAAAEGDSLLILSVAKFSVRTADVRSSLLAPDSGPASPLSHTSEPASPTSCSAGGLPPVKPSVAWSPLSSPWQSPSGRFSNTGSSPRGAESGASSASAQDDPPPSPRRGTGVHPTRFMHRYSTGPVTSLVRKLSLRRDRQKSADGILAHEVVDSAHASLLDSPHADADSILARMGSFAREGISWCLAPTAAHLSPVGEAPPDARRSPEGGRRRRDSCGSETALVVRDTGGNLVKRNMAWLLGRHPGSVAPSGRSGSSSPGGRRPPRVMGPAGALQALLSQLDDGEAIADAINPGIDRLTIEAVLHVSIQQRGGEGPAAPRVGVMEVMAPWHLQAHVQHTLRFVSSPSAAKTVGRETPDVIVTWARHLALRLTTNTLSLYASPTLKDKLAATVAHLRNVSAKEELLAIAPGGRGERPLRPPRTGSTLAGEAPGPTGQSGDPAAGDGALEGAALVAPERLTGGTITSLSSSCVLTVPKLCVHCMGAPLGVPAEQPHSGMFELCLSRVRVCLTLGGAGAPVQLRFGVTSAVLEDLRAPTGQPSQLLRAVPIACHERALGARALSRRAFEAWLSVLTVRRLRKTRMQARGSLELQRQGGAASGVSTPAGVSGERPAGGLPTRERDRAAADRPAKALFVRTGFQVSGSVVVSSEDVTAVLDCSILPASLHTESLDRVLGFLQQLRLTDREAAELSASPVQLPPCSTPPPVPPSRRAVMLDVHCSMLVLETGCRSKRLASLFLLGAACTLNSSLAAGERSLLAQVESFVLLDNLAACPQHRSMLESSQDDAVALKLLLSRPLAAGGTPPAAAAVPLPEAPPPELPALASRHSRTVIRVEVASVRATLICRFVADVVHVLAEAGRTAAQLLQPTQLESLSSSGSFGWSLEGSGGELDAPEPRAASASRLPLVEVVGLDLQVLFPRSGWAEDALCLLVPRLAVRLPVALHHVDAGCAEAVRGWDPRTWMNAEPVLSSTATGNSWQEACEELLPVGVGGVAVAPTRQLGSLTRRARAGHRRTTTELPLHAPRMPSVVRRHRGGGSVVGALFGGSTPPLTREDAPPPRGASDRASLLWDAARRGMQTGLPPQGLRAARTMPTLSELPPDFCSQYWGPAAEAEPGLPEPWWLHVSADRPMLLHVRQTVTLPGREVPPSAMPRARIQLQVVAKAPCISTGVLLGTPQEEPHAVEVSVYAPSLECLVSEPQMTLLLASMSDNLGAPGTFQAPTGRSRAVGDPPPPAAALPDTLRMPPDAIRKVQVAVRSERCYWLCELPSHHGDENMAGATFAELRHQMTTVEVTLFDHHGLRVGVEAKHVQLSDGSTSDGAAPLLEVGAPTQLQHVPSERPPAVRHHRPSEQRSTYGRSASVGMEVLSRGAVLDSTATSLDVGGRPFSLAYLSLGTPEGADEAGPHSLDITLQSATVVWPHLADMSVIHRLTDVFTRYVFAPHAAAHPPHPDGAAWMFLNVALKSSSLVVPVAPSPFVPPRSGRMGVRLSFQELATGYYFGGEHESILKASLVEAEVLADAAPDAAPRGRRQEQLTDPFCGSLQLKNVAATGPGVDHSSTTVVAHLGALLARPCFQHAALISSVLHMLSNHTAPPPPDPPTAATSGVESEAHQPSPLVEDASEDFFGSPTFSDGSPFARSDAGQGTIRLPPSRMLAETDPMPVPKACAPHTLELDVEVVKVACALLDDRFSDTIQVFSVDISDIVLHGSVHDLPHTVRRVSASLEATLSASYLNSGLDSVEDFVEPWPFKLSLQEDGFARTLKLQSPRYLECLLSIAMLPSIGDVITFNRFVSRGQCAAHSHDGGAPAAACTPAVLETPTARNTSLYRIVNASRCRIMYWVDTERAGERPQTHGVEGSASQPLRVQPQEAVTFVPAVQQYLTARTIHIQFEGKWSPLEHVIVDKVGHYAYLLTSHDGTSMPAVVEVQLAARTKTILLRSPLTVVNHTELPLLLRVALLSTNTMRSVGAAARSQLVPAQGLLQEGASDHLPLPCSQGCVVHLQADGFRQAEKDKLMIQWDGKTPNAVLKGVEGVYCCPRETAKGEGPQRDFHCCLQVRTEQLKTRRGDATIAIADHVLQLHPPLTVTNGLPYPMVVTLSRDRAVTAKSLTETLTIEPGHSACSYVFDMNSRIHMGVELGGLNTPRLVTVHYPRAVIQDDPWLTGNKMRDTRLASEVRLSKRDASDGRAAPQSSLQVQIQNSMHSHSRARTVVLYCKFWVMNHTGSDLAYKGGSFNARALGTLSASRGSAFPAELLGSERCSLKVGVDGVHWSRPLQLDSLGAKATIDVVGPPRTPVSLCQPDDGTAISHEACSVPVFPQTSQGPSTRHRIRTLGQDITSLPARTRQRVAGVSNRAKRSLRSLASPIADTPSPSGVFRPPHEHSVTMSEAPMIAEDDDIRSFASRSHGRPGSVMSEQMSIAATEATEAPRGRHGVAGVLSKFEYGVRTKDGAEVFHMSKVIDISPRFVVHNLRDEPMAVAQVGGTVVWTLPPGARTAYHWDNSLLARHLCVRPAGVSSSWSGAFGIDDADNFGLAIWLHTDGGARERLIVPVDITARGASFSVALQPAAERPPYRIENHHPQVCLRFKQSHGAAWDRLTPNTSTSYAWDLPFGDRRLKLEISGHEDIYDPQQRTVPLDKVTPGGLPPVVLRHGDQRTVGRMVVLGKSVLKRAAHSSARLSGTQRTTRHRSGSGVMTVYLSIKADGPTRVLWISDTPDDTHREVEESKLVKQLHSLRRGVSDINAQLLSLQETSPASWSVMMLPHGTQPSRSQSGPKDPTSAEGGRAAPGLERGGSGASDGFHSGLLRLSMPEEEEEVGGEAAAERRASSGVRSRLLTPAGSQDLGAAHEEAGRLAQMRSLLAEVSSQRGPEVGAQLRAPLRGPLQSAAHSSDLPGDWVTDSESDAPETPVSTGDAFSRGESPKSWGRPTRKLSVFGFLKTRSIPARAPAARRGQSIDSQAPFVFEERTLSATEPPAGPRAPAPPPRSSTVLGSAGPPPLPSSRFQSEVRSSAPSLTSREQLGASRRGVSPSPAEAADDTSEEGSDHSGSSALLPPPRSSGAPSRLDNPLFRTGTPQAGVQSTPSAAASPPQRESPPVDNGSRLSLLDLRPSALQLPSGREGAPPADASTCSTATEERCSWNGSLNLLDSANRIVTRAFSTDLVSGSEDSHGADHTSRPDRHSPALSPQAGPILPQPLSVHPSSKAATYLSALAPDSVAAAALRQQLSGEPSAAASSQAPTPPDAAPSRDPEGTQVLTDASPLLGGELVVRVHEARDLLLKSPATASRKAGAVSSNLPVFCTLEVMGVSTPNRQRSTRDGHGPCPTFQQKFHFRDVAVTADLRVSVWGRLRMGKDLFLGERVIPVAELQEWDELNPARCSYQLSRRQVGDLVRGEVRLSAYWKVTALDVLSMKVRAAEQELDEKEELLAILRHTSSEDADVVESAVLPLGLGRQATLGGHIQGCVPGSLRVHVIEATHLREPGDMLERRSAFYATQLYAAVEVRGLTDAAQQTDVVRHSLSPQWNQQLQFEHVAPNAFLLVSIYDKRKIGSDFCLCQGAFALHRLQDGKPHYLWLKLLPGRSACRPASSLGSRDLRPPAGQVHLRLRWRALARRGMGDTAGMETSFYGDLQGLHVTLVDSPSNQLPREVVHAHVGGVSWEWQAHMLGDRSHLSVREVQVDNQLLAAGFPVILTRNLGASPTLASTEVDDAGLLQTSAKRVVSHLNALGDTKLLRAVEASKAAALPLLEMSWERYHQYTGVVYFREFSVMVQEMDLVLEEQLVDTITEMIKRVPWEHLNPGSGSSGLTRRPPSALLGELLRDDSCTAGGDAQPASGGGSSVKWYFDQSMLYPLQINCTLVPRPGQAAADTGRKGMAATLGVQMLDLSHVHLHIKGLRCNDLFLKPEDLGRHLVRHLTRQALMQIHKVLGTVQILGLPISLGGSLVSGLAAFFYEPARGAIRGPEDFARGLANGTLSLLKNSTSGALSAAGQVSGGVARALAVLSLDEQFLGQFQHRPAGLRRSLGLGGKALGLGVYSGVMGLAKNPIVGYDKYGVLGAALGLATGAAGLLVKPPSGLFEAVAKTMAGLSYEVKSIGMEPAADPACRQRPPHNFWQDHGQDASGGEPLRNGRFSKWEAVLQWLNKGRYADDVLADFLQIKENKGLIFTDRHIIYLALRRYRVRWAISMAALRLRGTWTSTGTLSLDIHYISKRSLLGKTYSLQLARKLVCRSWDVHYSLEAKLRRARDTYVEAQEAGSSPRGVLARQGDPSPRGAPAAHPRLSDEQLRGMHAGPAPDARPADMLQLLPSPTQAREASRHDAPGGALAAVIEEPREEQDLVPSATSDEPGVEEIRPDPALSGGAHSGSGAPGSSTEQRGAGEERVAALLEAIAALAPLSHTSNSQVLSDLWQEVGTAADEELAPGHPKAHLAPVIESAADSVHEAADSGAPAELARQQQLAHALLLLLHS